MTIPNNVLRAIAEGVDELIDNMQGNFRIDSLAVNLEFLDNDVTYYVRVRMASGARQPMVEIRTTPHPA